LSVRLLVIRPQPHAARTALALRGRGHEPIVAPLIAIEALADADLGAGPWTALLLTSVNALSGLAGRTHGDDVRSLPVFTVGERTAQEIREFGFTAVTSADGNVNDLVNLVAARLKPPARLLYLAGEDRSGDLAGDLRGKGFAVETIVVYRAVAVASLPREAAEAVTQNAGGVGVLHFSRRSAEAYINAARNDGVLANALQPAHFCLSARVAEPLAHAGAAKIRVASKPTEAALLALID
jgi:uroporphyrinogen-III synthase